MVLAIGVKLFRPKTGVQTQYWCGCDAFSS